MKRIKSIDTLRGFAIVCMFLYHIQSWWIRDTDLWFTDVMYSSYAILGTTGFLFIGGVSIALSYRSRMYRIEVLKDISYTRVKLSYYLRASFIFMIAIIYNLAIAIAMNDLSRIWTWFILLTISVSLFIAWPLFKTSKSLRILIAIVLWIVDQFLVVFLVQFQGQSNFFGILFHVLYNTLDQDPFITFFTFFLIGTVIGDLIHDTLQIENEIERRNYLKNRLIIPCLITGVILIISGVLIQLPYSLNKGSFDWMRNFPDFLNRGTFSWIIYTMGIELTLISILFGIEEYEVIQMKRSYNFLFYFSYYSFTVYLGHNFLFFIFYRILDPVQIWFASLLTLVFFSLILKQIYKKWGWKASIKSVLGKLSLRFARKFEKKKKSRETK
jgi:uncharacterized membrane protein